MWAMVTGIGWMRIPRRSPGLKLISRGILGSSIRRVAFTSITLRARLRLCRSMRETSFSLTSSSTSTTYRARSCWSGRTPTVGSIALIGDRTRSTSGLTEPAAGITWGQSRKRVRGCVWKCPRASLVWKERRLTECHSLSTVAVLPGTSRASLRRMHRHRRPRRLVILSGLKMHFRPEQRQASSTMFGVG